jgi:DivIVA domain-containing protein
MSLTPEELERATFPIVKRGYDPHAVQRLLAEVAATIRDSDDFRRAGDEVATALRGLHGLLAGMKEEAEEDALRVRTEAEQEAFRVRTDAEQHAVRVLREAEDEAARIRSEAIDEARRQRLEADEYIRRVRADSEREREQLMAHAQAEVRSMLDDAHSEREQAKQVAAAAEQTLAAKRAELEDYLVAVTTLAENTARARVTSVLESYRAEVERLVAARESTSVALRLVRSSLEKAVAGLGEEVDLTDRRTEQDDELQPPALDEEAVDDAVAHALQTVASPVDAKPGDLF